MALARCWRLPCAARYTKCCAGADNRCWSAAKSEEIEEVLMKVWIDRDTCDSNLSACLSCFGQLVRSGVPDRGCIMKYEDDGSETWTVFMHSDGQEQDPIIIPKEMRD